MKWHAIPITTFCLILVLSSIFCYYVLVSIHSRCGDCDRYLPTNSHKYSGNEELKHDIAPNVYPQKLCELDRYETDLIHQHSNCCIVLGYLIERVYIYLISILIPAVIE